MQQVLWHSFFFLRSFLHFFPHFFMEFFLHFVFFILHVSSSLRLRQLTLGSGGDGGADGGAEGGSGSHKPQVFLHFCSFAASYCFLHCFFLHFLGFTSVSTHGDGGGDAATIGGLYRPSGMVAGSHAWPSEVVSATSAYRAGEPSWSEMALATPGGKQW